MIIKHSWSRSIDRAGTTVVELCVVLLVTVILFAIALPRLRDATDRSAARGAIEEAGSLFSIARRAAISRRATVGVVLDTVTGFITVRAGAFPVAKRGLNSQFGVRISANRDSMAYDPRGLGYGAANLTVVAKRGRAAETLYVSRLGRTRH